MREVKVSRASDLNAAVAEYVVGTPIHRMDYPCWRMYGSIVTCHPELDPFIAFALAALAAKGVTVELQEGWEKL